MVKNTLSVLILGSAAAALAMLAKSNFVLLMLSAALMFAATVLPFFAGAGIKFVV